MPELLSNIRHPEDLKALSDEQLVALAAEMREALVEPLKSRTVHFASNLGVVELCLALHQVFDFTQDRLIWDTGHQVYPHKLITGRQKNFAAIRTKGGLMGYPNPIESDFDLFMTGHAGCSVSCALGLKAGDDLLAEPGRKSIAVIGDGALPSGIVFEAFNNAAGLKKDLIVILNDNRMSICPRVGGLADALDKARMTPMLVDAKRRCDDFVHKLPLLGNSMERFWVALKDFVKSNLYGGMLFEEFGFNYFGPIDGHDIPTLKRWLNQVKGRRGPILLHVLTNKGHGIDCAAEDPVTFHTPPVFEKVEGGRITLKKAKGAAYTNVVSQAIHTRLANDAKACVITAAMCQGNKLEKTREEFPDRFFDTGICESHAVAFAAGLAKAGTKPIVAIYSTFLQRSFDQIFQEVALQNLPVVFAMDRAGLVGADGPTHHGVFDIPYMRIFPNMTVMAPGDELDVAPMLDLSLSLPGPSAIRYPKTAPERIERDLSPVELGQAEVYDWGSDGCFIAYGSLFPECVRAAQALKEKGYEVGVINARFCKPLDKATILKAVEEMPWVMTVEEGVLAGGFGSAVLEAAAEAGLSTGHVRRAGIPDRWIMHA
ncbi:MAG TPA: 1-deoxy-D-xylulose-5-phosphate synthase, partial [Planctomycetia bacterium]|nr:1-deoxy-D-xylulose-5-phosphate synthase [Planctomycetia bacterium]